MEERNVCSEATLLEKFSHPTLNCRTVMMTLGRKAHSSECGYVRERVIATKNQSRTSHQVGEETWEPEKS